MSAADNARVWTPERQTRLAELAAIGWSAAQIGADIQASRSAVIGRASRTGVRLVGNCGHRPHTTPKFWTPRVTAEARELWLSGMTTHRIAKLIGATSHHAVANKARSAKWGKHPSVVAREAAAAARRDGKRPEPMVFTPTECAPTDGVAFDDLARDGCRYALNQPAAHDIGSMRFCGEHGYPYCPDHAALCYDMPMRRAGIKERARLALQVVEMFP